MLHLEAIKDPMAKAEFISNVSLACKHLRDSIINTMQTIYMDYSLKNKDKLPSQWKNLKFKEKDVIDDFNYCAQVKFPK